MEAYRFLRSWFTNSEDVRYQRLNLRESDYQRLVPKLISSVEINRAQEKLIELENGMGSPITGLEMGASGTAIART